MDMNGKSENFTDIPKTYQCFALALLLDTTHDGLTT